MKRLVLTLALILSLGLTGAWAVNNNSEYYFGSNNPFDQSIPTPEDFFGFPIGSELVRYDRVVEYFRLLDKLSDRAQLKVIGRSH